MAIGDVKTAMGGAASAAKEAIGGAKTSGLGMVGTAAKSILPYLLAQMVISKAGTTYSNLSDISMQKEILQGERGNIDEEALFAKALLPSLETARKQAQEALISQLTGVPMKTLVPGEYLIGG